MFVRAHAGRPGVSGLRQRREDHGGTHALYRNTPHGKPQWSRPVYPDMTPESILWDSFQGEAAKHPFDANRYINWRFYWDYSGGNVYENMCHQLSFWYKALDLKIPKAVTMTGGIYLWKDGREVPDTMNVSLEHPEGILVSWDSGFGNNALGVTDDVLGTDGTISKGQQIRYAPQKVNRPDGVEKVGATTASPNRAHGEFLRLHPFAERRRTVRSTSASACRLCAAWRWTVIGSGAR